ncbi:MAG: OprO/OprP family phosphate-selective porin [Nitrospira sp.]|nr:OprO/OprP family phosphate-selective porin [Nitrospira sp.]
MRRTPFATIICVIGLGLIVQANIAQAGLEDILYEKGQITKEEWVKTKADQEKKEAIIQQAPTTQKWFEKLSIRGYTQLRYNYLTDDKNLVSEYDSSIGNNEGFLIRRARLVLSGDIHERVSLYLQTDFGATPPGTTGTSNNQNFAQLRDAYADIFLTKDKEWRIRGGISKVPFGFEVLQSSQQRAPLDRTDAINSAAPNERDTGLNLYYTPVEIRKLFRSLIDRGLKGTGDYGIVGVMVYNGETLNVSEANDNKHVALHSTYPFELPYGQIVQVGVDAYRGTINVTPGAVAPLAGGPAVIPTVENGGNILDERVGAHFVLYPQPFGFQAEWNWGRGPELNAARTAVEESYVQGGYVQAMYKWDDFLPYIRWQEYNGGKKNRTNSPFNIVRETEIGVEYQFNKALELTVAYSFMKRTDTVTAPYETHDGQVARFQLQWNY